LRQLEWSQRLAVLERNVLVDPEAPVGQSLYARAAHGGGRALGTPAGVIAAGTRADFVVLDGEDPALADVPREAIVDAAIFGPCRRPVRDVMVAGRWIVRDGHHPREDEIFARYRKAMAGIASSRPPR
jgi:formimidoylglutamate deiminase